MKPIYFLCCLCIYWTHSSAQNTDFLKYWQTKKQYEGIPIDPTALSRLGIKSSHTVLAAEDNTQIEIINLQIPADALGYLPGIPPAWTDFLVCFTIYPKVPTDTVRWATATDTAATYMLKPWTIQKFLDSLHRHLRREGCGELPTMRFTHFAPLVFQKGSAVPVLPSNALILTEIFTVEPKWQYFPTESNDYNLNPNGRMFTPEKLDSILQPAVDEYTNRCNIKQPSLRKYPMRFNIFLENTAPERCISSFFRYKAAPMRCLDCDRFWQCVQNGGLGLRFTLHDDLGIIECSEVPYFKEYFDTNPSFKMLRGR